MSVIRVHDKSFEPYLTAEEIGQSIKRLAGELDRDYADKRPLFIAVLNGAFMFASDLFKQLSIEAEICFI
jgi:hypoxanthine phosphoribosyltransferase